MSVKYCTFIFRGIDISPYARSLDEFEIYTKDEICVFFDMDKNFSTTAMIVEHKSKRTLLQHKYMHEMDIANYNALDIAMAFLLKIDTPHDQVKFQWIIELCKIQGIGLYVIYHYLQYRGAGILSKK